MFGDDVNGGSDHRADGCAGDKGLRGTHSGGLRNTTRGKATHRSEYPGVFTRSKVFTTGRGQGDYCKQGRVFKRASIHRGAVCKERPDRRQGRSEVTTDTHRQCRAGFPPLFAQDKDRIDPPETERVIHGVTNRSRASLVGNNIDSARRIECGVEKSGGMPARRWRSRWRRWPRADAP